MALATLCFTGFSRDDQAKAQQMFAQANADAGSRFELAPEGDAQVLVIDMDSMYGHMTWLKAQAGGKTTVGLTSGERCETDYIIKSPMSSEALRGLLVQLGGSQSAPALAAAPAPAPAASEAATATPRSTSQQPAFGDSIVQQAAAARTTGQQPAMPRTSGQQPAMPRTTGQQAAMPPVEEPARVGHADDYMAAMTTGQMAAMNVVPHEPRISDYLPANVLGGPVKLHSPGAPVLALDPVTQTYAGSATLKPLLPYVEAVIRENQLEAITAGEFEAMKTPAAGAQPYMRLLWLCGLTVGKGKLLPGYAANRKFVLTKWPQIEREYPKHFRLATVMMKGPALVKEIAELAGVSEEEVIDFVNAGLVTGAVVVEGTTATSGDVPRAVALLAKPRTA
jgi:hypothetical protein